MPKGKPKGLSEWIARKTAKQEKVVAQRTKLLPADLADQIVAAADVEIALLIARVDAIDAEIAGLRRTLTEVREEGRAAHAPVSVTPSTRRNWRGEIRHKSGRRGVTVSTPESIELAKRGRAISRRIRSLGRARGQAQVGIREAQKVGDDCQRGLVPGLLGIVSGWRNQVNLSGLAERVKVGRSHSFWSDAAGNPLPAEALDVDGRPLQHKH